jgi:hypothetical protein
MEPQQFESKIKLPTKGAVMKNFTKKFMKNSGGPYFNDSIHILYPPSTHVSEKLGSLC